MNPIVRPGGSRGQRIRIAIEIDGLVLRGPKPRIGTSQKDARERKDAYGATERDRPRELPVVISSLPAHTSRPLDPVPGKLPAFPGP